MLRRGFTLVELLVVISLIAVVSVMGFFMMSSNIKKARDAARKTDIAEIRLGLEQYLGDHDYYPLSLKFDERALMSDDGTKIYIRSVHQDPVGKDPYLYTYNASPAAEPVTYDLCAYRLEAPKTAGKSFCVHQMQ